MKDQHNTSAVIDCDLHNEVTSVDVLLPYLPAHWQEYIRLSGFSGPLDNPYPEAALTSAQPGTEPPVGGPPGSDLWLLREQVLDAYQVEYGILNCAYPVDSIHNPDLAAALSSAVNDWQIDQWLEPEARLRASLVVPSHFPKLAADEIDRLGSHPGFVQIFLPVRSAAPYGNRRYYPIFEAALRHDLVVGIQFGGTPGNPPTATGWPSFYVEEYVGMAQVFQSQIISLITEGLFDQYPTLRVALIESGFTWLPSLMWRFDKEWKGLRREIPWVRRLPSEYIREHIRFSLQPVDAPPNLAHLEQIIEQLGSDEVLMFSTDYPHWHFDTPAEAVPLEFSPSLRGKIMAENARTFYQLEPVKHAT